MTLWDLIKLAQCFHYKFTPKHTNDLCYGNYQKDYLKRDHTYDLYINDNGAKYVVVRTNKSNKVETFHTNECFIDNRDIEQVRAPLIVGELSEIFEKIARGIDYTNDRVSDMNRNDY